MYKGFRKFFRRFHIAGSIRGCKLGYNQYLEKKVFRKTLLHEKQCLSGLSSISISISNKISGLLWGRNRSPLHINNRGIAHFYSFSIDLHEPCEIVVVVNEKEFAQEGFPIGDVNTIFFSCS